MLVSEIIALAQDWTYTSDAQYPASTKGLRDFNIVHRELVATLNQDVNQDLFADYFWTDIKAGQSEYSKPLVSNGSTRAMGMTNMLNVSINYAQQVLQTGTISLASNVVTGVGTSFSTNLIAGNLIIASGVLMTVVRIDSDTSMVVKIENNVTSSFTTQPFYFQLNSFVKARSERASNLTQDRTWYRYNQPETDPFYIMYDTGIEIFPIKNVDLQLSLRISVTKDVYDLTLTDTSIVDDDWHYVIAKGIMPYIFQSKGQRSEAVEAKNEYKEEVQKMINTISDVQLEPFTRFTPNLPEFQ